MEYACNSIFTRVTKFRSFSRILILRTINILITFFLKKNILSFVHFTTTEKHASITKLTWSQIHPKSWSRDQERAGHSEGISHHLHLRTLLMCLQQESLIGHRMSSKAKGRLPPHILRQKKKQRVL